MDGFTVILSGQRADGAEEPLVQQLQQLQGTLVHGRAGTARAHQCHVDDGRVVVARVLPGTRQNIHEKNILSSIPEEFVLYSIGTWYTHISPILLKSCVNNEALSLLPSTRRSARLRRCYCEIRDGISNRIFRSWESNAEVAIKKATL